MLFKKALGFFDPLKSQKPKAKRQKTKDKRQKFVFEPEPLQADNDTPKDPEHIPQAFQTQGLRLLERIIIEPRKSYKDRCRGTYRAGR